ncbi:DUF4041 domain-containing protein [Cryobacterium fucosi]|uniref:DUF4041 domain-containing protein n=1 Tax=Cryobacterium fucosi TaxID=1259157 RepID=UPI00141B655E|nr:DUF4041 domain-containing protein [Cryobacterium fucosi]
MSTTLCRIIRADIKGEQMSTTTGQPPADWYADPTGWHERRYWDGSGWTDHVFANGKQFVDPLTTPTSAEASETTTVAVEFQQESLPETHHASTPAAETSGDSGPAAPTKVSFFGARKVAQDTREENHRLQALVDKHGLREIAELEATKESLMLEIATAQQDLAHRIAETEQDLARKVASTEHDLARQITAAQQELAKTQAATQTAYAERATIAADVVNLRESVLLQEFGLYDHENPAEASVSLATELESLRTQIKQAVRDGKATTATAGFTFNNSKAKGDKFVRDMSKLMLRCYNAEAENCLKSVRAGNLATAQKRLGTTVDQVERLGGMIDLHITPNYHRLRLRELELASRHLQALQVEKELERERREELRQQKQAEQELAREKERLEKERAHYANVLATLIANGDTDGAERIRAQIADVDRAIENVDYRAANIKAGYVYVISNIGSFGPNVVKIGMTRRLEPMDRVNELGDASVPFRFDVHALFFADNALSIEAMLHQNFADRRLNRVNLRREYFRATPAEVLEALNEHRVEVLEYTVEPAAAEYRSSATR